jgi:sarcosine oxidase subunit gamma
MPELSDILSMRVTPLGSHASLKEQRRIREITFVSKINLRGNPSDVHFYEAIKFALDLELPTSQGGITKTKDIKVLSLGPDEWLIISETISSRDLLRKLKKPIGGAHASIVDVSADRTIIALSGEESREILARGCGLDLHPRAFLAGSCAQTHLARALVILEKLENATVPTWHIYVANSFSIYLVDWLIDAARD